MIEDCKRKGKGWNKFEDHRLYWFVLSPCPLNFIEEEKVVSSNSDHDDEESMCMAHSHALKKSEYVNNGH